MKDKLKELAFFTGFFILAITIPLTVFLANQKDSLKFQSRADLENKAQLYVWPAALEIDKCASIDTPDTCYKSKLEIILDTKEKIVSSVNLYLRYDPKILKIYKEAIVPGLADENFNQLVKPFSYYTDALVDDQNGFIRIKAQGSFNGQRGVLATLFVIGQMSGKGSLQIVTGEANGTTVLDESGNNNVLGAVSGTEITVK